MDAAQRSTNVFYQPTRPPVEKKRINRDKNVSRGVYLQGQAVVRRSLILAAVVLAIIYINMVQLKEAHEISGRLQRKRQKKKQDVVMHG